MGLNCANAGGSVQISLSTEFYANMRFPPEFSERERESGEDGFWWWGRNLVEYREREYIIIYYSTLKYSRRFTVIINGGIATSTPFLTTATLSLSL